MVSLKIDFFPLDIYPAVALRAMLWFSFAHFWRTVPLILIPILIYFSTSGVHEFPFLHILASTCCHFLVTFRLASGDLPLRFCFAFTFLDDYWTWAVFPRLIGCFNFYPVLLYLCSMTLNANIIYTFVLCMPMTFNCPILFLLSFQ